MSEIFRHLRFKWYNPTKMELDNLNMGGVSFLLRPIEGAYGIYDVWMYITPIDAIFSNKHSVDRLRTAQKTHVVPFTQIQLDGLTDINTQIFSHFYELSKNPHLPSTIFDIIINLRGHNMIAEILMNQAKTEIQNSIQSYHEESIT